MSFTSSMWQAANISNLCGMNEGVAAVKTKSSLPMYQDDMESKRKRNIHLVKNYDGTQTHTVRMGKTLKLAGSIGTENLGQRNNIPFFVYKIKTSKKWQIPLKGELMFFFSPKLDVPPLEESNLMGHKKSVKVKFSR